nr:hypothetical protein BaRGS_021365 [Batillaria attramentaria]
MARSKVSAGIQFGRCSDIQRLMDKMAQNYVELGNDAMLISVTNDGKIIWEPGIVTETSCAVNIDGGSLLLISEHVPAGWKHTGVTFVVHLRRKRTFYILNTIIPVVMLSLLNVLVFILPADCGERMALAVTVLLSFTVYLGIISDNMPKTSESLSLLGERLSVCVGSGLKCIFKMSAHPTSWHRHSTLRRKTFRSSNSTTNSNNRRESMDQAHLQETGAVGETRQADHMKELQVVCETKVKVRENGENEVQRHTRRRAGASCKRWPQVVKSIKTT